MLVASIHIWQISTKCLGPRFLKSFVSVLKSFKDPSFRRSTASSGSFVVDILNYNTVWFFVCKFSPQAALDWFAMKRFYDDSLGGVTQPSQRRFDIKS